MDHHNSAYTAASKKTQWNSYVRTPPPCIVIWSDEIKLVIDKALISQDISNLGLLDLK